MVGPRRDEMRLCFFPIGNADEITTKGRSQRGLSQLVPCCLNGALTYTDCFNLIKDLGGVEFGLIRAYALALSPDSNRDFERCEVKMNDRTQSTDATIQRRGHRVVLVAMPTSDGSKREFKSEFKEVARRGQTGSAMWGSAMWGAIGVADQAATDLLDGR